MLDPDRVREDTMAVVKSLKKRGFNFDSERFLGLDQNRKGLQMELQRLQQERNERSKVLGMLKAKGEDISAERIQVSLLGDTITEAKSRLDLILEEIESIHMLIPNLPHESVPEGKDEQDNLLMRTWGSLPKFDFEIAAHDDLGIALGLMDFEVAAKITGSRFVVLKAQLARMHRALVQFMLDVHVDEHHYQELYLPYLVNESSLRGTGQLPKFEEDLFKLLGHEAYYLIPTGEIPMTNMVRSLILSEDEMPIRYVSHTPCFRSEAGSYGRDTKGMIRQHQFEKVELVWLTHPKDSYEALEQLTAHAEVILQRLELPYRVILLCTGDMGFSAAKTYDIEVWMPSQAKYREISSCSNTEAFQARRMQARFRPHKTKETQLIHTLNGSGLAVGRTLVAIMENYQDENGIIHIPQVLKKYMGGLETIEMMAD